MPKIKPHRHEEEQLWQAGHRYVAGVDEAGKGAWAGPIVAGAVILGSDFDPREIGDSKQLTPLQRELLFVHITRNAVAWAVGVVPPAYIDHHGIVQANKKAMLDALKKLAVRPQAVLVDAVKLTHGKRPVKAIIDGDALVLSIAAASILAKVTRDTLMAGEHRLHPLYEFHLHKGYGTPRHEALIAQHGISPIHRRTFRPMNGLRKPAVHRKR